MLSELINRSKPAKTAKNTGDTVEIEITTQRKSLCK